MSDVTYLLDAAGRGDAKAAAELLPLVYHELRELARRRLAREAPGHTLQATALVHEAYVRLVGPAEGGGDEAKWHNRGHFFAAAAEAMRRILIEAYRRKTARKRGGDATREDFDVDQLVAPERPHDDLLALDEALDRLAAHDPSKAELVKLRYFAGLTLPEAAEVMQVSLATANRHWAYARAWLHREVTAGGRRDGGGDASHTY